MAGCAEGIRRALGLVLIAGPAIEQAPHLSAIRMMFVKIPLSVCMLLGIMV